GSRYLYPLVTPWRAIGPDLKDAGWKRAGLGNRIRNWLGVGPCRQEQGCAAAARLPQLFEADAAVGTKRGTRSLWPAMGLRPGVLCTLGGEQRGGLRRSVQQLLQLAGV